jgi:hypothetical protein
VLARRDRKPVPSGLRHAQLNRAMLSCQIGIADLTLRPFGLAERASPYHTKEKNRIIHASMQMRFFSFVWHGSCLNQIFVYSVTFFFCNTTTTAAAAIANTATA